MKWSSEARIGIVVFLAAVVFAGGIIVLRGIDLRSKDYSLNVHFGNVNGLNTGSRVSVAGLEIGSVESMTMSGNRIEVNLSLKTRTRLPRDSKAIIKSESIMGGKFVEIIPGTAATMLQNGDSLSGAYEADLSQLTATLAPISTNVLGILENVNSTFDEPTRNRIQAVVANLSRSTAHMDQVINREGARLDVAFGDFAEFSKNISKLARTLDTIAGNQRGNVNAGMSSLKKAAQNLDRVSVQLDEASSSLNLILAKVKSGEGTMGRLIYDAKLYNDIDTLAVNLNSLVLDLRLNPQRYVKVSVF